MSDKKKAVSTYVLDGKFVTVFSDGSTEYRKATSSQLTNPVLVGRGALISPTKIYGKRERVKIGGRVQPDKTIKKK